MYSAAAASVLARLPSGRRRPGNQLASASVKQPRLAGPLIVLCFGEGSVLPMALQHS